MSVSTEGSRAQEAAVDTTVSDTSDIGYLKVDMGPRIDSLYVVIDQNFDSPHYVANGDTLALSTGEHYITLAMKNTRDLSLPARIRAGTVQTIETTLLREKNREMYLEKSSYPVLHNDVNLVVVTDRDSRISVDDQVRGRGIVRLRVSEGHHLIETSHSKAGRTRRVVTVQTAPPRLRRVVMYNKPSRAMVRYLSPLPGLSQFYREHEVKGLSLFVGFLATSIGGLYQTKVFADHHRKYKQTRELYEAAETEEGALRLGNKTERLYKETRAAYWRRNVLGGLATATFLYSFLDAWLNRPEGGYRIPLSRRAQVEPLLGSRRQGVRLVVRF